MSRGRCFVAGPIDGPIGKANPWLVEPLGKQHERFVESFREPHEAEPRGNQLDRFVGARFAGDHLRLPIVNLRHGEPGVERLAGYGHARG